MTDTLPGRSQCEDGATSPTTLPPDRTNNGQQARRPSQARHGESVAGKMPNLQTQAKRQIRSHIYKRMKSLLRLSAAILAAIVLASCGTNVTMLGPARPAISPSMVRIYQAPPRHFQQIAIINSSAGTS